MRGEDRYGHFDLINPPTAERDAAALAVHQRVSDECSYQVCLKNRLGFSQSNLRCRSAPRLFQARMFETESGNWHSECG